MSNATEYVSLEMKTLNKSRIRSAIFLARSHIKSNSWLQVWQYYNPPNTHLFSKIYSKTYH